MLPPGVQALQFACRNYSQASVARSAASAYPGWRSWGMCWASERRQVERSCAPASQSVSTQPAAIQTVQTNKAEAPVPDAAATEER